MPISASSKYCGSCGRRIGFGVRSENEIRAALNRLEKTTFVVKDINMKPSLMNDIAVITYSLNWAVGEEDLDPVDMMAKGLQIDDKVIKKDKPNA